MNFKLESEFISGGYFSVISVTANLNHGILGGVINSLALTPYISPFLIYDGDVRAILSAEELDYRSKEDYPDNPFTAEPRPLQPARMTYWEQYNLTTIILIENLNYDENGTYGSPYFVLGTDRVEMLELARSHFGSDSGNVRFPILYDKNETNFEHMGLGALVDCLKCEITREINGAYELSMEYPVEGVHFNDIGLESIIAAKVQDKNKLQLFKIYAMSEPIDMTVTIDAEHISYMTGDIPLIPFSNQIAGIDHILEAMNTIAIPTGIASPFAFYDNLQQDATIYTLTEPASMREVMGNEDGMLLSIEAYKDCEWDIDNFTLTLTNGLGSDKSDLIRYVYGKNVSDINQDQNITNTITGLLPYVHAETDDDRPINVIGSICYGVGHDSFARERIVPTNVESYFTDEEKESWTKYGDSGIKMPTQEQVTAKGAEAIKDFDYMCTPEVTLRISPVDLTNVSGYENISDDLKHVCLGDMITVIFNAYGINKKARIIKTVYDTLNACNTSIEIGDPSPSLAATLATIGDKVEVNRAGVLIKKDSILAYVNKSNGELGSQIQMTEDSIMTKVSGNYSGWNMVPITGKTSSTGGEELTINLYNYGDPDTHYNAGFEYNGYHYFDDNNGAVWYCHQVSGVWRWDHYIWTKDHGRVATGTEVQMQTKADADHLGYSWLNTTDDLIYLCEKIEEEGEDPTYEWSVKDPQTIQLTGQPAYAERMDVYANSAIEQTDNQIVLKVDANGHMALCELSATPDGSTLFNVLADNINFEGHTFNLSTDDMTIVSNTTRIDENGYVVYYLCQSTDVGAVPLAGGLYYNKKIIMAFQDGNAGWSLEDRALNAFSELRGNNFVVEQIYDSDDWSNKTDKYVFTNQSYEGYSKAYLSMNPRWFGMYHKNDADINPQIFDYRLGHFTGEDVSDLIDIIDIYWDDDRNPKNPDESMLLMQKPTDYEQFAMMVNDQLVMVGSNNTSKLSPKQFRVRNAHAPAINSWVRADKINISDYFDTKSPYKINNKPMYTLTNDDTSVTAGTTDLDDGCFIIVYDGPNRTARPTISATVSITSAPNDTVTITDDDDEAVLDVVTCNNRGKGSSSLSLKSPGRVCVFTSSIYSSSITKFINGDDRIEFEGDVPVSTADWEVSWSFGFGSASGLLTINSDYDAEHISNTTGIITRDLISSNMNPAGRTTFTAVEALMARVGSSAALASFAAFAAEATIATYSSGYEQLVVAKKNAGITIPAEIGFFWRVGSSAQGCILKRDGTFIPWSQPNVYGEVLGFNYSFSVLVDRNFTGTLKYYTFGNVDGQGARWVNVQTPVSNDITMDTMIVFAIPQGAIASYHKGMIGSTEYNFKELYTNTFEQTATAALAYNNAYKIGVVYPVPTIGVTDNVRMNTYYWDGSSWVAKRINVTGTATNISARWRFRFSPDVGTTYGNCTLVASTEADLANLADNLFGTS